MTGDRHIDRHQTVRGPAERWTPVDHGNGPWFAQVADIEDYAAAMPTADIKPVPPADRMVAAMVAAFPARRLTAGGPLARHPPTPHLFWLLGIGEIQDHDDGSDIAFLLGGDIGIAAVESETMHAGADTVPMVNVPRLVRVADVEHPQPDEIVIRHVAARPLPVREHDVVGDPHFMRMQARRYVDRSGAARVFGIRHIDNRCPVWRIHVPDIGVIAIQNDLSATRAIQPCDLS